MSMDMDRMDKERPRTARKITRIKDLYWYIKKHGIVKVSEIEEEFSIPVRTIQRDLDVLEYNELIFSPKRGYYQTTDRKVKGG